MKPLTVKQLIEILSKLPQDIPVVVDGDEWGVGRITENSIGLVTVGDGNGDSVEEFKAVCIDRDVSPDRESYGMKLETK